MLCINNGCDRGWSTVWFCSEVFCYLPRPVCTGIFLLVWSSLAVLVQLVGKFALWMLSLPYALYKIDARNGYLFYLDLVKVIECGWGWMCFPNFNSWFKYCFDLLEMDILCKRGIFPPKPDQLGVSLKVFWHDFLSAAGYD